MRTRRCASRRLFLTVMLLALAGFEPHLFGQASQDIAFADFQFNRSLPGARSLAMAGAFAAVADDATAAYSNPSGLTLLTRPEASAEFRSWTYDVVVPDRGRISGSPTGVGIDEIAGLDRRTFASSEKRLAFASGIYVDDDGRWAAGTFHHILASYDASVRSQGVFSDGVVPRFGPYRARTALQVSGIGASLAGAFGACEAYRSCLRLGVSLIEYSLDLDSRTEVLRDPPPEGKGAASFDDPPIAIATTRGTGDSLVANIGLLWEVGPHWRLAAVYRQAPDYEVTERIFSPSTRVGHFRLPDQIVVGVALQPSARSTISLEYEWVEYSNIAQKSGLSTYRVDDAHELRLGGEWVHFWGSDLAPRTIALMAGAWLDPDHRVRFDSNSADPATHLSEFRRAYFAKGEGDELHATAGLGANFGPFQLDFGADVSHRTRTLSISTVVRF